MKILHLLTSGNVGGIEVLCKEIGLNSRHDHTFVFMFGEGLIYEDMLAKGLNVISLPDSKKISKNRLKILSSIAEDKDVIITHHYDPFLELYYLALEHLMPGKMYISMVHHCYDEKEEREEYGFLKRIAKKLIVSNMFKKSDRLIFVSKQGCNSYKGKYQIDENKVSIVYNGIGKEKIIAGGLINKESTGCLSLLYLGRLEKIKGVAQLIEALGYIHENNYTLKIVGDGNERKQLEEAVFRLNLQNKVSFVGFQKDVDSWFAKADIFVYPSVMEIFGISLVEAMAFKCVCVANNVGGIPEIVCNGENGILNLKNNAEGLAESIQEAMRICKDRNSRKSMMEKAIMTAKKFSIDNTIKEFDSLLEETSYE